MRYWQICGASDEDRDAIKPNSISIVDEMIDA